MAEISQKPQTEPVESINKPDFMRRSLKQTFYTYTYSKTKNVQLRNEMTERAVAVAQKGAKTVRKEIANMYQTQNEDSSTFDLLLEAIDATTDSETAQQLTAEQPTMQIQYEQERILKGQESKLKRMKEFSQQMS